MNLMEQCDLWNENEEYQKIIDAIEALPQEAQTPQLICDLARAYNNMAGPEEREHYHKAIALLKSVEEQLAQEHNWNFRMAYAYYYLDQEGPALRYFQKALEARPGDEDTQGLIDDCAHRLSLPHFEKTFRQRTEESWAAFVSGEDPLRSLMDQPDRAAISEELVEACNQLLSIAFEDVSFELGKNGERYELILTPEGDKAKLFQLVYFQRQAPLAQLPQWDIIVGRQSAQGFNLRAFGEEISGADVLLWVDKSGKDKVNLALYCQKLLPLLQTDDGKVWWLLSTLVDQVMGEIPAMAYIDDFDVLETPRGLGGVTLDALPQTLEAMGMDLSITAERFLEGSYSAYQMKPDEAPEAELRMDVYAGASRCVPLINAYMAGESDLMDAFHQDGAVPGFFYYPLDGFAHAEERGKAVLDFRDALEVAVQAEAGEAVTFLGGASGVDCGYLDFLAWDLPMVLEAAVAFFDQSPVAWGSFHTFRREVGGISLVDNEGDEDPTIESR